MEFLIYGLMVLLIITSLIGIKGNGLFRLFKIVRELEKAVHKKICSDKSSEISKKLKDNSDDFAKSIFSDSTLRYQLNLYQSRYHQIKNGTDKEYNCDIEDYINLQLLEQIGRKSFCEHTASGLTALGVLGTFIGLIAGLDGFNTASPDTITLGISMLLSGMSIAFNTSVVGIIASLLFGIIYKNIFSRAEYSLCIFLETFRINIDNTHSEDTMNGITNSLNYICRKEADIFQKLDKICELNEARDSDAMKSLTDAYVAIVTEAIKAQMSDFSKSIDEFNENTKNQIELLKENAHMLVLLKNQIKTVCTNMQELSNNYNNTIESVRNINHNFKNEIDGINNIISSDISLMQKREGYSDMLFRKYQDMMDVSQNNINQANTSINSMKNLVVQVSDSLSNHTEQSINNISQLATQAISDVDATSQTAINNMTSSTSLQIDSIKNQTSNFVVFMNESIDTYFQSTTEYLETVFRLIAEGERADETPAKVEELANINKEILNTINTYKMNVLLDKNKGISQSENLEIDQKLGQVLLIDSKMLESVDRLNENILAQNRIMNNLTEAVENSTKKNKKKWLFGFRS